MIDRITVVTEEHEIKGWKWADLVVGTRNCGYYHSLTRSHRPKHRTHEQNENWQQLLCIKDAYLLVLLRGVHTRAIWNFFFILEPFLCQFSTTWGLRNSSASTSTHHGSWILEILSWIKWLLRDRGMWRNRYIAFRNRGPLSRCRAFLVLVGRESDWCDSLKDKQCKVTQH